MDGIVKCQNLGGKVLNKIELGDCTLYHGDCLKIMKDLQKVDAVITDPPYPDYYKEEYKYFDGILEPLTKLDCRQLIFWSAKVDFPLDYSAIHIWDKWIGCGSMYERIFERHGGLAYQIFKYAVVGNEYRAKIARDVHTGHPSQKPILLLKKLTEKFTKKHNAILDPFMGSGTTGVACVQTGRKFIGIEIEKKYFDIAVKRIKDAQQQMRLPI